VVLGAFVVPKNAIIMVWGVRPGKYRKNEIIMEMGCPLGARGGDLAPAPAVAPAQVLQVAHQGGSDPPPPM